MNIVHDEAPDDFVLGDRELDVMAVLWEIGSGTVAEVRERLPAALAYTTVLTILRNLEEKGFLSHEAEGRAHRYHPRVARQAARRSALARLIDKLFHGSPEQLIAQLVEDRALTAEDLRRLHRRVGTREETKTGTRKGSERRGKR
ncbi:MAG: BlaI/MecI/CopY family transcriptional regulator [Gemmatimonadaceae bacterium]